MNSHVPPAVTQNAVPTDNDEIVPAQLAEPLILGMGLPATQFDNRPSLAVPHVPISTAAAGRRFGPVPVSAGQAVPAFNVSGVPEFQRRGHPLVHLGQHLGQQRPPAMTSAPGQGNPDPTGRGQPPLGHPQDDVQRPFGLRLLIHDVEHGVLDPGAGRKSRGDAAGR